MKKLQLLEFKNGTIYLDGEEVKNLLKFSIHGNAEDEEIVEIEMRITAKVIESGYDQKKNWKHRQIQRELEVGDRVRIRDWEDMVKEHGEAGDGWINPEIYGAISPSMKEFCGRETTIAEKGPDIYTLEIDGKTWIWPRWALKRLEEENEPNLKRSNVGVMEK